MSAGRPGVHGAHSLHRSSKPPPFTTATSKRPGAGGVMNGAGEKDDEL